MNTLRQKTVPSGQQGFTLIEVVLAIAITAFVAALGYSAISTAINTAEQHEQKAQELSDVQLALSVLERDIRNAVARPIIDEYGHEQAALSGGELAEYALQLTRRGWANPSEVRRGELQRVRYEYSDNTLWREHWLVLDRVDEDSSKQRVKLISGVELFELRFLKPDATTNNELGGEWQPNWDEQAMPAAVEINFELTRFGLVRRVFEILNTPQ
ncbi:type II secretion system minor pseudopilin GspJ [Dasania sp. GY-MA-18]|uniref:Type II secretion system protein J n=1 Tax=Dasania phycosphaerae TaxID=2950436 RepID=A0A9J6RMU3_9GAMM|nr:MULTISPECIES: type II secretion system minor pseudopilin GspJ [Dasania]MCR8923242.1 type II secretion system minor pseudopilin GspJ [Dasania sp. GY-MA-18]MCZ0865674.1 type II secretion system minor pseudopilin GspJ [Dasania phycosphaerae]MCZ0869399.1 type II secretion system minor pseudopilin GspJ [Dasania phycosphaerae]